MSTNTLHITVESTSDFFDAALADVRQLEADADLDDEYVLSLPDEQALERVLNAKNLTLLRTIADEQPESIREIARQVDRDVKNVSTALAELEELGLVRFEQDGRAKQPVVWYDHLEIDVSLSTLSGTSDTAPA
ncbi:MarR family transcriptional regulator [Halarchaeum salinum]|uniref:Transcriptional regulator n=1 Tax=Halarchaeum salinum TaxID=489912 RepID=A0AAV3S7C5_9EURY